MADRKVLNKYYPPDFDPTKLPRLRVNPVKTFVVRIMAPFNMRCNTCGEYIYKGKKFNSKKEDVLDMDYLGLKIFRFFIKCTRCLAEISFRTDPENTDYVCEQGASRNFQAHDFAEKEEKRMAKEEADDEANPMKALEKRTKDSKNEMDIIDALEELKDLNARRANTDIDTMLEAVTSKKNPEELADEEDAKLAREMFEQKRKKIKRLETDADAAESDDLDTISNFSLKNAAEIAKIAPTAPPKKSSKLSGLVVKKKKKLKREPPTTKASNKSTILSDSGQTTNKDEMNGQNSNNHISQSKVVAASTQLTSVQSSSVPSSAAQSSSVQPSPSGVGISLLADYSCSDSD
ncbi:splicing factor YJU2-like [Bolinopsis microptera]|uniref:splicing factor YJU2-like n=1 Tax=Bolinopsis microptera TaxID=2820187 RepID=UPI00307AE17F